MIALLFSRNRAVRCSVSSLVVRFDEARHVWQTLAALGTGAAAFEHFCYGARAASGGAELPVGESIANADIHGGPGR